jgi:hypothetical protein
MKTKPILQIITVAAFLLAASLQPTRAVGYYNVALSVGWNLLSLQLSPGVNSNANNVLGYSPCVDGSLLDRFNPATQSYYDAGTFLTGVGWCPLSGNTNDPVLNLAVGEAFFIWTPATWTATIVGDVLQGSLTNPLPAYYSLKASMVPIAGGLQTTLAFPPYPGDVVFRETSPSPFFTPYWYDDLDLAWSPSEPTLAVGEGFFLYRDPGQATPNHWWIRNFTVQFAPSPPGGPKTSLVSTGASPPAEIRSLVFRDGNAVLTIQNDRSAPYNVQFSSDGVVWKTVGTGQTAPAWQEPIRPGGRGYYQLVNP